MVLHKQLNGERIQLSEEEETQVRREWAKNDVIHDREMDLQNVLSRVPSVEERLMNIESCIRVIVRLGKFSLSREKMEAISKCKALEPLIQEAREALLEQEAVK